MEELRIGDRTGDRVTVSGPAGELALVVAGRHEVSAADVDGPDDVLARLFDPAVSL